MPLAVVTGTGRGLGRALTTEFDSHGWTVIAVQRPSTTGISRAGSSDASGQWSERVAIIEADLRSPQTPDVVWSAIDGRPVDVLVNNAVSGAPGGDVATVDMDVFTAAMDVNLVAPLRLVKALSSQVLAAPHPLIVNVSSRLGSISAQASGAFAGFGTSYAYRVSKAALNMLTVCLAEEFTSRVRCFSVHPGRLTTDTGRSDAHLEPAVAAQRLFDLVDRHDLPSPQFLDLEVGASLNW